MADWLQFMLAPIGQFFLFLDYISGLLAHGLESDHHFEGESRMKQFIKE